MKNLFTKKHHPHNENEKDILWIEYDGRSFNIKENDKDIYSIRLDICRPMNVQPTFPFLFGNEKLLCTKKAVDEVFYLLKQYNVIDLLEEVKQSGFRDIMCSPILPFRL